MADFRYATILAADTATKLQSVALWRDGQICGEKQSRTRRGHSSGLINSIDGLLQDAGMELQDIDLLVYGKGPGGFTGLRIALASLKSLAFVHGKPMWGESSLEALAMKAATAPGLIVPLFDARKKEVYAGLYRHGQPDQLTEVMSDRTASAEQLVHLIATHRRGDEPITLIGSGLKSYGDVLVSSIPGPVTRADPMMEGPSAGWLAAMAALRAPAQEDMSPIASLQPNYQRASEAELGLAARIGP